MRRYVFRLAILSLAGWSCSGLGSSAVRADDQQIAQQIIEKLQAEKQAGTLKGFSIDLQVDEGTVWLSGRVANEQQQDRALDLARRISGVQQVVNDLTIAPAPSKAVAAKPMATKPAAKTVVARPVAPPVEMTPEYGVPATSAMQPLNNPYVAQAPPTPAKKPASPSQNSMLNSVSKALLSAVHGGQPVEATRPAPQPVYESEPQRDSVPTVAVQAAPMEAPQRQAAAQPAMVQAIPMPLNTMPTPPLPTAPVQAVSVSQEVAAATGGGPIGSGVEQSVVSARRSVVQAAQPVANLPQQVATADSLQPVYAAAPQMAAMMPMPMQMQMPYQYMVPVYAGSQMQVPLAMGAARPVNYMGGYGQPGAGGGYGPQGGGAPVPMYMPGSGVGVAPARYDHPQMPGYAWPSYAAHPNYAAVTYPKQYSPSAWPYIGPFHPYPQVPLGWRKVTMEWDDGWWMLDFKDRRTMYNH
jgi:BON domain